MVAIGSVLVTGANRGLGLEFIRQFINFQPKINHIFATCRNPESATDLQALASTTDNVHVIKLDVRNYAEYDDFYSQVETFLAGSGLDLLINNAGIHVRKDLNDVTAADMIENFETNTVTPLMLVKKLLPLINSSDASKYQKKIVNITSKMGSISDNTSGGRYPYRASKAALNMVTKNLSIDLAKDNILCLALHPGWVLTDMGGPDALITVEQSITGMLNVILNSNQDNNGRMIAYDGKIIGW